MDWFNYSMPRTFGSLPQEATLAMLNFMETHQEMETPDVATALEVFKDVTAWLVDVSLAEVSEVVFKNAELKNNHASFAAYHQWYMDLGNVPVYSEEHRWPVLLGTRTPNDNTEVFIDGWHRLHAYITANHTTIPVLDWNAQEWDAAYEKWQATQTSAPCQSMG